MVSQDELAFRALKHDGPWYPHLTDFVRALPYHYQEGHLEYFYVYPGYSRKPIKQRRVIEISNKVSFFIGENLRYKPTLLPFKNAIDLSYDDYKSLIEINPDFWACDTPQYYFDYLEVFGDLQITT